MPKYSTLLISNDLSIYLMKRNRLQSTNTQSRYASNRFRFPSGIWNRSKSVVSKADAAIPPYFTYQIASAQRTLWIYLHNFHNSPEKHTVPNKFAWRNASANWDLGKIMWSVRPENVCFYEVRSYVSIDILHVNMHILLWIEHVCNGCVCALILYCWCYVSIYSDSQVLKRATICVMKPLSMGEFANVCALCPCIIKRFNVACRTMLNARLLICASAFTLEQATHQ